MKEDLLTKLQADLGLIAITGDRGQWYLRPRAGALPDYTLSLIAPGQIRHHGGTAGIAKPRLRAESWGRTYTEAGDVADALMAALQAPGTAGGTRFLAAFFETEQAFDPETMGDGTEVVRIIRDFTVWHQPA